MKGMAGMHEIYVREKFDSAHFLPGYDGKCANLHGHTWVVEITIRSTKLASGMVIDFFDVKTKLREILPDHALLNDVVENPTAENLAQFVYEKLKGFFPELTKVAVWESDSAGAAYFED
jgi:6-pyruvoyltetrahydropterin/6-carboxytetrahydropterin synthase